ncbi:MAG: sporulation protein YtxC [Bacilli bacterium]
MLVSLVFIDEQECSYFTRFLQAFTKKRYQRMNVIPDGDTLVVCSETEERVKPFMLAEALTHYVIEKKEPGFLRQLAERKFPTLAEEERDAIVVHALDELMHRKPDRHYPDRRSVLFRAFVQVLSQNDNLSLLGFYHFRLIGYFHLLDFYLDVGRDALEKELKYYEAVELLRLRLRQSEMVDGNLHLYWDHGKVTILDDNGQLLDDAVLYGYVRYPLYPLYEVFQHGTLLGGLVALCPARIYIYDGAYHFTQEWLPIQLVFEDRCEIL